MDEDFVTPTDLAGVVDAFTGEVLNAALGLYQCGKCQVYYHRASFDVIRTENGGKCVACLSTTIRTFSLKQARSDSRPTPKHTSPDPRVRSRATTDDILGANNYRPAGVTLSNYREHVGRVIAFEGFVEKVMTSRSGLTYAIMFEDRDWRDGFKVIIYKRHLAPFGGAPFVHSLQERSIRVRGLLQNHATFGYQIIVTERSMLQKL